MDWAVFSYIGLFFAVIYRIPQIIKIYRTKSAADLSSYSYVTHNGAYASFILYLIGTGKLWDEWVLCFYYFMGISQNLLIFLLKRYYEKQAHGEGGSKAVVEPLVQEAVVCPTPSLQQEAVEGSSGAAPVELYERREYAERRQWFKRRVGGTQLDH